MTPAGKAFRRLAGLTLAAVLLLSGCGGGGREDKEAQAMTREGKLQGVEYRFCSGSLYGADFAIELKPEELVSASYFAQGEDLLPQRQEKSHTPITAQQWQEVERAVDGLRDILEPVPEPQKPGLLDKLRETVGRQETVMDGGDTTLFALTWEADGQERRVEYYACGHRRFVTLLDLLHEIADPTGREITWYE